MTIAELTKFINLENISPYSAFVYYTRPSVYEYPSFWTDTFGFPGASSNIVILIKSIEHLYTNKYSSVNSISNCVAQEKSFFFDIANQVIYVHVEHTQSNYLESDLYQYGRAFGYTDKDLIYIDDLEYLPYLKSVPSIAQQEDLQNYNKLSLITGSSIFENTGGNFDNFIDENIYGNDIEYFYLNDSLSEFTRSDLVPLASVFIDDYEFSMTEFEVFIQDKRAAQNIDIPSHLFSTTDYPNIDPDLIGEPIPLIYGSPRISKAYPVNGETTGNVTYRQAELLTTLGTVEIKSGDSWASVTPVSSDLSTGSFVLDYADCRDGGISNGDVLDCRVLGSTGIINTYGSDIIKDLNDRELGIPYNSSNYNTTEWETEELSLSSLAVVFDKPVKLFEAIRQIQNGSNRGFRYEINSTGLRTIRIYNELRTVTRHIENVEIFNINDLPVKSNKDLLAAIVKVNYDKDFYSGNTKKYIYDSKASEVLANYKQSPTLSVDSLLTSEADAITRALFEFSRFGEIPRVFQAELIGEGFFNIRIYDTITIEITPGFYDVDDGSLTGREYFGCVYGVVVSVDPDFENLRNSVGVLIIRDYIPRVEFVADHSKVRREFIEGTTLDTTFVTYE